MEEFQKLSFAGKEIFLGYLPNHAELTSRLLYELNAGMDDFSFSHKIGGRWENSYLPIEKVPSVRDIVRPARDLAVNLYGEKLVALFEPPAGIDHPPFWFNLSETGDSTGVHNHARESVVSGVYYLEVPIDSGDLFFRSDGEEDFFLVPEAGTVVLFPSELRHGVRMNSSSGKRVSLAFNLFAFPLPIFREETFGAEVP
jgi:hypothetical protein